MKKRIITIIFSVLVIGGILFMADKNIQMGQRNSSNTEWDKHYPITKAENVLTSGGTVASEIAGIKTNKAEKTYVDAEIQKMNSQVQGFYNTTALLTTAFPNGNSYLYVVNEDKYIYKWSGTEWLSTGYLFGSAGIANKSVTREMLSFPALNGIAGKNLFDKDAITAGYYISYSSGNAIANASYVISDWIPVNPSTQYIRKNNLQLAFYGINKNYISGIPDGTAGFTTPSNAYYVRYTLLPWFVAGEQLELGSISTTYEAYGAWLDIATIKENSIPMSKLVSGETLNSIIVKTDGTGNYTNLSSALASITDSSKSNRYTVYIYEGTYDVYSTLTASELSGIGILLPDGVDLVGVGDRDKIILKMELSDATTNDESTRLSTLNVKYNNNLSNLTVIAKNCRYPIHADNSNTFKNYEQHIENCVFWHKGAVAGLWQVCNAWGEGTASGATEYFKNCIFRSDKLGGFSSHNNTNFTEPTYHQFDNCEFISALGFGSFGLISMASTQKCRVVLNGCKITGYIGHTENTAGCGFEYEVTGHGNTLVPYTLVTTLAGDQPFINFTDEITIARNNTASAITRGTPLKHSSGFGVVPMTSSDTIEVFAGICMVDCAIGDACYYKVKGYYNLSAVSLGTATSGTYIGVTNGQLAVVANKVDAIGKVIYNGGQLKLY